MKTWLNHLYILCVLSVALFSCKKEEERLVLKEGGSPSLSASATTLVLNKANASDTIISFTSTPANYGYQAAVNYILEMDVKGSNFANAKTVDLGSSRVKKYTVAELNSLLSLLKLAPGTPGEVEVRLKSVLSAWVAASYSSVVSLTVTPYEDIVEYPSLYVPGGYQGWTPAAAAKVASVKDDKNYEGYVYFQEASEFKFTNGPNWDGPNYGDAGAGKLSSDGGAGNLKVNTPGYYRLNVDLNGLTWSATKTAWGIIGNATGSWDVDQDMTYDAAEKVWKATLSLTTGEIKFRANDDWGINFGDAKLADGTLEYGADNIAITEAGTYDIVLDLSKPGNYSYSVTKK